MNVLAIGAHPDDIEIGCGGTLLKMSKHGHKVFMLVMTCGDHGGPPEVRVEEQKKVGNFIGAQEVFWGEETDTKVRVCSEVISRMDVIIQKCAIDLVLFNHPEDTHQDHRSVALCALSATRTVKRVLCYELITSMRFTPNIFVDIEDVIEDKDKLLRIHDSQIKPRNGLNLTIPESVRVIATFRGFQAKVDFAEGFMAQRLILNGF